MHTSFGETVKNQDISTGFERAGKPPPISLGHEPAHNKHLKIIKPTLLLHTQASFHNCNLLDITVKLLVAKESGCSSWDVYSDNFNTF